MRSDSRQSCLPGLFDTSTMVAESIAYLRAHEPEEGYFVGFSGGKDSIVTLALCEMAGVKFTAFYSCTRIDPPEVVKFIKQEYPGVIFLMPKMTFWEGIRRWAPPIRMQRWCCSVLKKDPAKHIKLKMRVMGIRAEESTRRASRPRTCEVGKITHVKPIFSWKEYHVWDFIEAHGIAYPSLYDEGFHRLGCVVCPFFMGPGPGKTRDRELSMEHYPQVWKAFKAACKSYFEGGYKNRRTQEFEDFEDYYAAYLLGFEKERACK